MSSVDAYVTSVGSSTSACGCDTVTRAGSTSVPASDCSLDVARKLETGDEDMRRVIGLWFASSGSMLNLVVTACLSECYKDI